MKLVFLTPGTGSYYCGVCMRDNALAREMIRQGHEAMILPMYLPLTLDETPAAGDAPVFYGGINVYLQQKFAFFRNSPRWLDRLLNYRGFLKLAGKNAGMSDGKELGEITLSMLQGEHGKQAKELEELVTWLKEHAQADAIWLSTALLAGLARRLTQELKIPVLCSLQDEDSFLDSLPEPWRSDSWRTLAERSREVATFVAPSRYYADFMGPRLELRPEQMRVLPNGISLEGFEPRTAVPEPPVLGYLARFIPGKGLGIVVDAFIELRRRGKFPARLRCIGAMTSEDEKYVAKLKQKLAASGLAGQVEFLPNVTREEKFAALKTLTLLSVPATYGEAFGLYLIEALAAGVPVVQPRTAAFPEIVEETGGGVLYEGNDAPALVKAWETLLADPERGRELGRQGRAAVEREYTIERLAERYLELTRDSMAEPARVG